MKIVFIGASNFGLKCLENCLDLKNIELKGIITAPKHFKISYSKEKINNILHADFENISEKHKIPLIKMDTNMKSKELFKDVFALKPDLFLVVGWYHMIPDLWINISPAYGLHASLLPKYKGGAPLVWAMINGEKETGITLFKMNKGVDSGDIIGQEKVKIYNNDTIKTLYSRVEIRGIKLIRNIMPKLAAGEIIKIKKDNKDYKVWPQRSPEDGLINWNNISSNIDRFIRAQTKPYPGAFTIINNTKIIIWESQNIFNKSYDAKPGELIVDKKNEYCAIKSIDGSIKLNEIEIHDKTFTNKDIFNLLVNVNKQINLFGYYIYK